MFRWKNYNGYVLLEVVIAMAIFAGIAASIAGLTIQSLKSVLRTQYEREAVGLLQEGKEAVRYIRDVAWNDLAVSDARGLFLRTNANDQAYWALGAVGEFEEIGRYTRSVSFAAVCRDANDQIVVCEEGQERDIHTLLATIWVRWNQSPGGEQEIHEDVLLTNWESIDYTQNGWFVADERITNLVIGDELRLAGGRDSDPACIDVNWDFTVSTSYIFDEALIDFDEQNGRVSLKRVKEYETTTYDFQNPIAYQGDNVTVNEGVASLDDSIETYSAVSLFDDADDYNYDPLFVTVNENNDGLAKNTVTVTGTVEWSFRQADRYQYDGNKIVVENGRAKDDTAGNSETVWIDTKVPWDFTQKKLTDFFVEENSTGASLIGYNIGVKNEGENNVRWYYVNGAAWAESLSPKFNSSFADIQDHIAAFNQEADYLFVRVVFKKTNVADTLEINHLRLTYEVEQREEIAVWHFDEIRQTEAGVNMWEDGFYGEALFGGGVNTAFSLIDRGDDFVEAIDFPEGQERYYTNDQRIAEFSNNPFTIDVQFLAKAVEEKTSIFQKFYQLPGDGPVLGYQVALSNDNRLFFEYVDSFGVLQSIPFAQAIALDRWYHLAIVFDEEKFIVYLDGIRLGDADLGNPIHTYTENHESFFAVGFAEELNDVERPFEGYVDELRLTNGVHWMDEFTPPTRPYADPPQIAEQLIEAVDQPGAVWQWINFDVDEVSGDILYQLSSDGNTWQYYNNGNWQQTNDFTVLTGNTSTTINTHIGTFDTSTGKIYYRAYLPAGAALDEVRVDYRLDPYTIALWHFDGPENPNHPNDRSVDDPRKDYSEHGYDLNLRGDRLVNWQQNFNQSLFLFPEPVDQSTTTGYLYISETDEEIFDLESSKTFDFWLYAANFSFQDHNELLLFHKWENGQGYLLSLTEEGVLTFTVDDLSLSTVANAFNLGGAWGHIAVVIDEESIRLFINGVEEAQTNIPEGFIFPNTEQSFFIGGDNNNISGMVAAVDEFRISSIPRWTENFEPNTEPYQNYTLKQGAVRPVDIFEVQGDVYQWTSVSSQESYSAHGGIVRYRFSTEDPPNNWQYWNGNAWGLSNNYEESNTLEEVNAQFATFATNTPQVFVQAILEGNGSSVVTLDDLTLRAQVGNGEGNYSTTPVSIESDQAQISDLDQWVDIHVSSSIHNDDGNILYQFSPGVNEITQEDEWYYFDGNTWVLAANTADQANSTTIIYENIWSFPIREQGENIADNNKMKLRAWLKSDEEGLLPVSLDDVNLICADFQFEVDKIDELSTGEWQDIELANTYKDPIIMATYIDDSIENNPAGTQVRINRTVNSSTVQMKLVNSLGEQASGEVHYMAIERGVWRQQIPGVEIEADYVESTNVNQTSAFRYYPTQNNPLMFYNLLTDNNNNEFLDLIASPNSQNATIKQYIDDSTNNNDDDQTELLGAIIINEVNIQIDNQVFRTDQPEVFNVEGQPDGTCSPPLNFQNEGFISPPLILGGIQSSNVNNAWLNTCFHSNASTTFYLEKRQDGGVVNWEGAYMLFESPIASTSIQGEMFREGNALSQAIALDSNDSHQVLQSIAWDADIPADCRTCEVKMQVRMSALADPDPLNDADWNAWYGVQGSVIDHGESYFTHATGTLVSPDLRYYPSMQYQIFLSGDGEKTPIVHEIRLNYK